MRRSVLPAAWGALLSWMVPALAQPIARSDALAGAGCPAAATCTGIDIDEMSKQAENPVTRIITLPFRYKAEFLDGPYKSTKSTFELDQAVLPFQLSDAWALVTRTKLPGYSQPPKKYGANWNGGLGNGYTTFFLSPSRGDGFYWGVGPVLFYPTATNAALGVNKWGSGPSFAFFHDVRGSNWVYGAVVNTIWSFGGPPHSSDRYSQMLINPFADYHFGNGWAIGTSPNITANWLAKAGQVWTVPVGGGVSKTIRIGSQPVKFEIDSYYNAVRAQAGNDTWLLQFTVKLMFPS